MKTIAVALTLVSILTFGLPAWAQTEKECPQGQAYDTAQQKCVPQTQPEGAQY